MNETMQPLPGSPQVREGVQREMSGEHQATSADQQIYNIFVKAGAVIANKVSEQIQKLVTTKEPVRGLAQATVMVVTKAIDQLGRQGMQVPDQLILEGGKELMAYIYTQAKMELSEEQKVSAMELAIDMYLGAKEQSGELDTTGMDQIVNKIKTGDIPERAGVQI